MARRAQEEDSVARPDEQPWHASWSTPPAQRVDDVRVRGRTPDAQLFQRLHQRALGVAPRRLRLVPRALYAAYLYARAFLHLHELLVLPRVRVVRLCALLGLLARLVGVDGSAALSRTTRTCNRQTP